MKPFKISEYSGKEYVSFWEGGERKYFDEVEQSIVNRLLPRRGKWFADLGCGFGRFKDIYLNRFENIIMVDYSDSLLNEARRLIISRGHQHIYFVLADIYNLPFQDNSLDVSLMARVFHHLESPGVVLDQVRRVMRHRGEFIFNYYNKRNIREVIRFLRGKSKRSPFRVEHVNVGKKELLYYSHPRFIHGLLNSKNLIPVSKRGVGVFYGSLLSYVYKPVSIEKGLSPLLGEFGLSALVFLKTVLKKEDSKTMAETRTISTFVEMLICPSCKNVRMVEGPDSVFCSRCRSSFTVKEGIYDLRSPK